MTMKDLPPTSSSMFLDRVRETLQSLLGRGDPSDRAVTVNDLDRAGIASPGSGGALTDPTPDMTPPPTPTGFTATAGTTQILFQTDTPRYTVGHGHARTIIYGANWSGVGTPPTFADAVELFNYAGPIDSGPYDPASNLRLWARWKSVDGALSPPAGGTNGVTVTMGLVDNLMISNLSVAKLLAGSLSVGQYIQSADYVANTTGFRIQTLSGGQAFMEINGGAVIGGSSIGATYIQSNNYTLNTSGWKFNSNGTGQIGAFAVNNDSIQSTNYSANTTGWRLKNDGTGQIGGFTMDTQYISANYVAGTSGWKLVNDGQILSKHFNISAAGNATFSGALSAASGTFAGSLSAATGTFSGALSGATGTFAGTLTAQVVNTANIVGAAITQVSSASGSSPSVTISVGTSDRAIVVIADGGYGTLTNDGDTVYAPNLSTLTRAVNGGSPVTLASGNAVVIAALQDPGAGSYEFELTRSAQSGYSTSATATLVVMLTKR